MPAEILQCLKTVCGHYVLLWIIKINSDFGFIGVLSIILIRLLAYHLLECW